MKQSNTKYNKKMNVAKGMKIKLTTILILLFGFLSIPTYADQTHVSKQFEETLLSCLPGGKKEENCLVETILKYTKNKQLQEQVPSVINGLFDQLMGDGEVFAVHPVKSTKLRDFIIENNYIVEKSNGSFALLQVAFLKTLEVWQIHNVHITSKDEAIDEILGVNI